MSDQTSIITWMFNVHVRFLTWRRGEKVGTDRFGNTYWRDRAAARSRRERRWVLYKGEPEASRVPPEWHAWLHHNADAALAEGKQPWRREHQENPSGSVRAYRPQGHSLMGGRRVEATGDYEPWTPA